jgi:hypothetical protein
MTVTYTLTWEEYAEQFQNAWPRPDYFSAIVACMVAVPLIGYGISLAVFGPPGETLLYSMFIGAPLFLVVATIVAMWSQAGPPLQRAIAQKRLEYERWHAKEQAFSFDGEKWTHETSAGKQETPWSALTHAKELPTVFSLTGESISVLVPKRALDSATLVLLRETALPVRGDGWSSQITWGDYSATESARAWRKYWFLLIFGNVFGFLVLGWVVHSWLIEAEKLRVIWGWILACSAVILTLTAQLWYLPLRYFTSRKAWRSPLKLEFSDRGVHVAMSGASFFTAWRACRSFREVGRAFLIYTDEFHYYLLPKRYINLEQQTALRQMLQAKLKRE